MNNSGDDFAYYSTLFAFLCCVGYFLYCTI